MMKWCFRSLFPGISIRVCSLFKRNEQISSCFKRQNYARNFKASRALSRGFYARHFERGVGPGAEGMDAKTFKSGEGPGDEVAFEGIEAKTFESGCLFSILFELN